MAGSDVVLRIDGAVGRPQDLTVADLDAIGEEGRVFDVSRFHPARRGDGVWLESLLARAVPEPGAEHVTLHAGRDDYHVSVPLGPLRAEAVVVYRIGEQPLSVAQGGPIRLVIRDPSVCSRGELDDCANVKSLDRIEVTKARGRDTRPADEAAHAALHARQTPGL